MDGFKTIISDFWDGLFRGSFATLISLREVMINITGLDPVLVFRELFNRNHVRGMGFLNDIGRELWDQEIGELLKPLAETGKVKFDYVYGKPIKVEFVKDGDQLFIDCEYLYDRDMYPGACMAAVMDVKKATKKT